MATGNPFDLLGGDDSDDPSQLIAAAQQQQKLAAKKPAAPTPAATAAKLPSKPLPPAQAVREARSNVAPSRGGPGRGRGGRGTAAGSNRDFGNDKPNGFSRGYGGGGEEGDADRLQERERAPRPPYIGGRRGGYGNNESGGDSEQTQRRTYDRRSGTGRGYDMKRQGAGRGNWGTVEDETLAQEKDEVLNSGGKTFTERQQEQDKAPSTEESKDNKEGATNETEEKEEDKEMTLEEYEKIKEEKRKALDAMKAEERKVEMDEELQSMQQLSTKKAIDPVFAKLGSDKDTGKKKEAADRDERSKKSLSINQFLKPAEGDRFYNPGGRGRGRGRGGDRGSFRGAYGSAGGASSTAAAAAPSIEDPGQFPTLGGK